MGDDQIPIRGARPAIGASHGGATPADAATRHCPMLLAFLRPGDPPQAVAECGCRGPRCMAWRWGDNNAAELHRRGFCGLAGRLA